MSASPTLNGKAPYADQEKGRQPLLEKHHFDVVIVGAGLSGIDAACRLTQSHPRVRFVVLEARERIGGTWDLFRYPGIRSDSDMYTLGFPFRPWPDDRTIADGPTIRRYVEETAREYGVDRRIRFGVKVVAANWSSARSRWELTAEEVATGNRLSLTATYLYISAGYYRYDRGYIPDLPQVDRYRGTLVHAQHWPEELDYAEKRVVVIGSGATAVTLVPALAQRAAKVTMLQRTPTYIVSLPAVDPLARWLRSHLPERLAYHLVRAKNVAIMTASYKLMRRFPRQARAVIRAGIKRQLGGAVPLDPHFAPPYNPWDQRLCVVPDGDLFKALVEGKAEVVTDRIERFTEDGLQLRSGRKLSAEIVVLATGLELQSLGGIDLSLDGKPVDLPNRLSYKGVMLDGVPNALFVVGYINASWTLKADLVARYFCKLLGHARRTGKAVFVARPTGEVGNRQPLIDLKANYVLRALDRFPKQGGRRPWLMNQNYLRDLLELRFSELEDGELRFAPAGAAAAVAEAPLEVAS